MLLVMCMVGREASLWFSLCDVGSMALNPQFRVEGLGSMALNPKPVCACPTLAPSLFEGASEVG